MLNKNLAELIEELLGQVQDRRDKIESKIASLEQDVEKIKSDIAKETKDHIQCELSGDAQGQEKCNKSLRKLREQLNEVQDLISAYKYELDKKIDSTEDISKKIQTAALKERKERYDRIRKLNELARETEIQITELQNKSRQITADFSRARLESEINALLRIQDLIAPCLGIHKIDHYDRMKYLACWVEGDTESMESILAKYEKTEDRKPRNLVSMSRVEVENPNCDPDKIVRRIPGIRQVIDPSTGRVFREINDNKLGNLTSTSGVLKDNPNYDLSQKEES